MGVLIGKGGLYGNVSIKACVKHPQSPPPSPLPLEKFVPSGKGGLCGNVSIQAFVKHPTPLPPPTREVCSHLGKEDYVPFR